MNNLKMLTGAMIVVASMVLLFSCERHCVDCPKEPEPPPSGKYRLYAFNAMSANGLLMSIDIPADTIVDSVRLDYSGNFIFVTPDGERLLVTHYNNDYTNAIEIYRTRDLAHMGTSNQYGFYYFDGTDNYGILVDGIIQFIDPLTLSPVDTIFKSVRWDGYLDTVSNEFFAIADSAMTIYRIDCSDRMVTDSFSNLYGRNIMKLAYNRLTNDIYYFTKISFDLALFVQYSCDFDSVMSVTSLYGSTGAIAISPNCKKVYVTDGGMGMLGVIPPGQIWVFDALTHNVEAWIPDYNGATGKSILPLFGQFIITPDDDRAYIGEAEGAGGASAIPVVDLGINRIIKTVVPDSQSFMLGATAIALGPIPKN
ncbi:exported hypothetical protein [Candidatus Zixiibacteriota bacterium]|nr:exported hypothetical protein [candidate division Zixibacteria bacterium]